MSIKLSDTQLVMLSTAAQRDDHCLVAPQNLKGGTAQKVAAKLISAGLVKEIKAKSGAPVWRRDEQTGQSFALKLTAAGAKAIAVDECVPSNEATEEDSSLEQIVTTNAPRERQAPSDADAAICAASSLSGPRSGTKLARVVELLQRDRGATIDELVATTGWLPHTTRAALTGLRKRGFAVAIDRSNAGRGSTYCVLVLHIVASGESTAGSDNPPATSFDVSKAAARLAKSHPRRA